LAARIPCSPAVRFSHLENFAINIVSSRRNCPRGKERRRRSSSSKNDQPAFIMRIESVQLLGGETGRDFVQQDDFGTERFTARLMDDDTQLVVIWTDNVPRTVLRLHDVQLLAGGPHSFDRISGIACDQLEAAILAGTFDADQASRMLSRALGENWQVRVL